MLIAELASRYKLRSNKAVYDRLAALEIKLDKDNRRRSYANAEQIEILDRLDQHIQEGGTLKNFPKELQVSYEVMDTNTSNTSHTSNTYHTNGTSDTSDTSMTLHNTSDTLDTSDTSQVIYIERDTPWNIEQQDPLTPYRLLDEAVERGYPLTSKSIKEILGIKPKGKAFTRLGFSFTKIGKDGAYSSWSVERYDA